MRLQLSTACRSAPNGALPPASAVQNGRNAALAFPSSIALFGGSLYAVNARFNVPRGQSVEYAVVRVQR
jgi:hypothetical protein